MLHSRIFLVVLIGAILSSGSALRHSHFAKKLRAEGLVAQESASSCYYNLFARNSEKLGFGGATITVQLDGSSVSELESLTLPALLHESGWSVPVTAGSKLTFVYTKGESTGSNNEFWVTDANGHTVLSLSNPGSGSYQVASVACRCVYPAATECPALRMRNEYRSLTYCDKTNYLNALQDFRFLNESGVVLYDMYVVHHYIYSAALIEKGQFLPWHRMFILWFENDLRAMGGTYACLTLPYWDWTLDFGNESIGFPYNEMGGLTMNNQTSLFGRFENWTDPTQIDPERLTVFKVHRRFARGASATFPFFPSATSIELAITANSSYAAIYRALVRNPHKAVHNYIGGPQGSMSKLSSPADPFFWIHHGMIDRVWAMWQDCYDYEREANLERQWADLTEDHSAGLDALLVSTYPGRDVVARHTLDIRALGYSYPPSYEALPKLDASRAVYEADLCSWDWFSPAQQAAQGLSYRVQVHSDMTRARFVNMRSTYAAVLATSNPDYYDAKVQQLTAECVFANGFESPDFPAMFNQLADVNRKIGPALLFKNSCKLLQIGALGLLFDH